MTMLRREDVKAAIEERIKAVGVAEEAYMLNAMPDEKREMSIVAAGLMMALSALDALPAASG